MPKVIFLSPHLDDVVLSCSSLIQRFVASGNTPLVATVFSEGLPTELYAARKSEDVSAIEILSAKTQHLGLRDAPFREFIKQRNGRVLFGDPTDDNQTLRELSSQLKGLSTAYNPEFVYVPLGVGWHIDHLLVFEAALRTFAKERIRFYAEQPYSFSAEQLDFRLNSRTDADWESLIASIQSLQYAKYYLSAWSEADWKQHLRLQATVESPPFQDFEKIESSSSGVELSIRAVSAYETQLEALFSPEFSVAQMTQQPERYFVLDVE